VTLTRELVHGTCVALGERAALLRGGSGAGKSDLALRFIALPPEDGLAPQLVADDQVWVEPGAEGGLVVSPPESIAGQIEVRGVGIVEAPHVDQARLVLVVDLVPPEEVPRMPMREEPARIAGVAVARLKLFAFEPSSPLKLKLALLQARS
jgi:serine kinase of HPr protein (carbohydrate metabolism regulator)